jgi:hypothetical protein
MGFTHRQGAANDNSTALVIVTLGSTPIPGNLLCCGATPISSGVTVMSVADTNGNAFQITPNSPSAYESGIGTMSLFWMIAPSNATSTIHVTFSAGTPENVAFVDEFSFTGGMLSFDLDVSATGSSAGTTVNTPSITPHNNGSLVYACSAGVISAPAAGATLGSWTGCGGGIVEDNTAEYILNQSATAIAVDYTQTADAAWAGMAMAFYLGALESFIDTYSITL